MPLLTCSVLHKHPPSHTLSFPTLPPPPVFLSSFCSLPPRKAGELDLVHIFIENCLFYNVTKWFTQGSFALVEFDRSSSVFEGCDCLVLNPPPKNTAGVTLRGPEKQSMPMCLCVTLCFRCNGCKSNANVVIQKWEVTLPMLLCQDCINVCLWWNVCGVFSMLLSPQLHIESRRVFIEKTHPFSPNTEGNMGS